MRKELDRLWVGVGVCHFLLLYYKIKSFQLQRTKTFQAGFEKVHLAGVQIRDGNLCIVKSVQKLTD